MNPDTVRVVATVTVDGMSTGPIFGHLGDNVDLRGDLKPGYLQVKIYLKSGNEVRVEQLHVKQRDVQQDTFDLCAP